MKKNKAIIFNKIDLLNDNIFIIKFINNISKY